MKPLHCDMYRDCTAAVSHVDVKGFIYCKHHGLQRRTYGVRCRALLPAEIKRLQNDTPIRY